MQNDPEYFSRPDFVALRLDQAHMRAARTLPKQFSQIFGSNIELWLDLLAQRVLDIGEEAA